MKNLFSGVDCRVKVAGPDGETKTLGLAQAISLKWKAEGDKTTGEIVMLLQQNFKELIGDVDRHVLWIEAENDYGSWAVLYGPEVVRITEATTGIAVDDIVFEAVLNFEAVPLE